MNPHLIYDWNKVGARAAAGRHAGRRDLARRAAVTVGAGAEHRPEDSNSPPHRRLEHRHRGHRACPGRVRTSSQDVEALAREIAERRLRVRANCAARTHVNDIAPIVDIVQRTGVPIECCAFIGSSPIRQYTEGWTLEWLLKCTEDAISFAVRHGLDVMYVTEDTTRADPDTLRAIYRCAIRAGAKRICIADTVGHATPSRRRRRRAIRGQRHRRDRR